MNQNTNRSKHKKERKEKKRKEKKKIMGHHQNGTRAADGMKQQQEEQPGPRAL